jgi:hypothetical protein
LNPRSEIWKYIALTLLVFASRLPFIFDGYGLDGDSWSVAITANAIHATGEYSASRLPGYPVHEYLCSWFIIAGPAGTNTISAFFSAVAVLFFALTLRLLRFRYIFLAAATLAVVPIFYIHSTSTIDYNIALGFIMASMYFLLRDRLVIAGILLGFAIGTRITSGAMIIPFAILLLENSGAKNNIRRIVTFAATSILAGGLLFVPVFMKYGTGFFTYYNVPYPAIPKVLYKLSIEVWGVLGVLGIIVSTGLLFLPNRITSKKFLFPRSINEKFVVSWLVAIDLYIIAFLKLPMESGYLIPIIPFVILIFGKYLYNKAFVFFCSMLIASSALCTISPQDRFDAATTSSGSVVFNAGGEKLSLDFLKGPVLSYQSRRQNGICFVNDLLKSTDTIKEKSVIVCGKWYNQMIVECNDTAALKTILRDYLNADEAVYFYAKGYKIYFLPKQDFYNKIMRNTELDIYGAEPYLRGFKN